MSAKSLVWSVILLEPIPPRLVRFNERPRQKPCPHGQDRRRLRSSSLSQHVKYSMYFFAKLLCGSQITNRPPAPSARGAPAVDFPDCVMLTTRVFIACLPVPSEAFFSTSSPRFLFVRFEKYEGLHNLDCPVVLLVQGFMRRRKRTEAEGGPSHHPFLHDGFQARPLIQYRAIRRMT